MTTMTKTFDCIEMKRNLQKSLLDEYEKRKDEFASYYDFIIAKADASELAKQIRAKIARLQI